MKTLLYGSTNGPYFVLYLSVTSAALHIPSIKREKPTPSHFSLVFPPARGFLAVSEAMPHRAIEAGVSGGEMKVDTLPSTAYVGRHASE